ncbi:MAG: PAS domain-containing protein [Pseudolabrys sp.]|nr:PAS domain-containing protein [Pseudolabrys sp.]
MSNIATTNEPGTNVHPIESEAERESRLEFALAAGRLGYWEMDPVTRRLLASDIYKANWGRKPNDPFNYEILRAAVHPDDLAKHEAAVEHALQTRAPLDVEYRNIWPDGSVHWLRVRGHAVYDEDGNPVRMAGISLDVTEHKTVEETLREEREILENEIAERKRVERHQDLLLAELNHRVKNTLAIVLSIATQTLRHSGSAEAFRIGFEKRIMALAEAHNLLTDSNWEGASLRAMVARVLDPYQTPAEPRYHFNGSDIRVGPKIAVAVVMALNELATNAAKYGALSRSGGRIDVSSLVRNDDGEPRLEVVWRESGGPQVRPPSRKGFGTRLITGLSEDAAGSAEIDFAKDGLIATFNLPLTKEAKS